MIDTSAMSCMRSISACLPRMGSVRPISHHSMSSAMPSTIAAMSTSPRLIASATAR